MSAEKPTPESSIGFSSREGRPSFRLVTFLLGIAILAAIPLALYAGYLVVRLNGERYEAMLGGLRAGVDSIGNDIQEHIRTMVAVLEVVAQQVPADAADQERFDREALAGHQVWRGGLIQRVDRQSAERVFAKGASFHGAWLDEDAGEGEALVLVVPIRRQGRIIGGLRAVFPPDFFERFLIGIPLAPGWRVHILDRRGRVRAGVEDGRGFTSDRAGSETLAMIAGREGGVADVNWNGERRLAFHALPTLGWVVTACVPAESLDGERRHLLISTILIGVICLALAGLGAFFLACWLERRANEVIHATIRLGRGLRPEIPSPPIQEATRFYRALSDAHALLESRMAGAAEAMRQAEEARLEAEQANEAKTRFLAAASHDLRQPVQGLFLFTAALARHVDGDEGRHLLGVIDEGLHSLKALLDRLLDMSRLDVGKTSPEFEDFPLAEVVDPIVNSYTAVAANKGLSMTVDGALTFTVRSDRTLLARMLRNLIENAVRYTRTGRVWLECRPNGRTLDLVVHDTGDGIEAAQLERIFEEFHRGAGMAGRETSGLGLGLAIVRRLSELLDHPVEVRSQRGQGSSFAITLPLVARKATPVAETGEPAAHASELAALAPEPAALAPDGAGRAPDGGGPLALLVDDNPMVREALEALLSDWGYRVAAAADGEEATARLAAFGRAPEVILSDYRLRRDRTGVEVILAVRRACGRAVPALLLTGDADEECLADAKRHGIGIALKPIIPQHLALILDRFAVAAPSD